jgi:hypothetical protein
MKLSGLNPSNIVVNTLSTLIHSAGVIQQRGEDRLQNGGRQQSAADLFSRGETNQI